MVGDLADKSLKLKIIEIIWLFNHPDKSPIERYYPAHGYALCRLQVDDMEHHLPVNLSSRRFHLKIEL